MRGDISGEGERTAIAIGEFLRARDKADVQMAERCCSLQIIRLRKQHDRLFFSLFIENNTREGEENKRNGPCRRRRDSVEWKRSCIHVSIMGAAVHVFLISLRARNEQ